MATIAILNLRPAGYDLLSDSQSFMSNLSEELSIQGGLITRPFSPLCYPSILPRTTTLPKLTRPILINN